MILPHGVLFRGGAEATIRREIIRRGYIKGIIGLPANLFYGTGIPACIIVLDKENAAARKGIFLIDASKGFIKDGNKNRLRAQDIHKIVDTFTRQIEVGRYSRMVPVSEISDPRNDFNLNLPRYIDSSEPEDLQDIDAHLRGGIPDRDIQAFEPYWKILPSIREVLFESAGRPGYSRLKVPIAEIKNTIFGHPEFTSFNESATQLLARWKAKNLPRLKGITKGCHPKDLIEALSEDLLETFEKAPLLDAYDLYQHLMDYWEATMQDDVYMISSDGWQAVRAGIGSKSEPNTDLIPAALIVARYFAKEQAGVQNLEVKRDAITRQLEELDEEHGGEDGILAEGKNEKGKLTKASVKARLGEIDGDKEAADEREVLESYLAILENEGMAAKVVKEVQKMVDGLVGDRYSKLTTAEIIDLVVEDKWLMAIGAAVQEELARVSHTLTGRIRQLSLRYETTLQLLIDELATVAARVEGYLNDMGAHWK